MEYVPTIGLEVHAELNTKSKMFCGCENNPHAAEPNSLVCPVCTAQPGSLPVPNISAIQKVLLFGRAVEATHAKFSEFDRKNYFYPDIPKAYQISQYKYPFLTGGSLLDVELTRVHLEEDTARSQHDKTAGSVVDFNRAGVPLMELVTEPVIHDAKSAGDFARELQLLLRTIGISDANMERGEMRVEANISVSKDHTLGTKVEVKNINSFSAVESAIEYEIARHIEVLESGGTLVQETRGWDENKNRTFPQRTKETAKDYRYFPDPDLPKMNTPAVPEFSTTRLDEILPELPNEIREYYKNLGLKSNVYDLIISNVTYNSFFKDVITSLDDPAVQIELAANYFVSDILGLITNENKALEDIKPEHFAELIVLTSSKKIGSRVAKDLLPELFGTDSSPLQLATDKNLLQVSDTTSLKTLVAEIIAANPDAVAEYKAGKEASAKYLLGQGMKASKGAADPQVLNILILEALQ